MKNLFFFTVLAFCLVACTKFDFEEGIVVNNKELMSYLLRIYDTNKDGKLSKSEALKVTMISIRTQDEIDGLENFPNLKDLSLYRCAITDIDLSKNIKLTHLSLMGDVMLKTLDLTNNAELFLFYHSGGVMESIYLGHKPKLIHFRCSENKLTALDLSGCENLELVECYYNLLTEIDVSQCPHLLEFSCLENQLKTLDVSNNTSLNWLSCRYNDMDTLFMKEGQKLQWLSKDDHTEIVYR